MSRRKLSDKPIHINEINEELRLIDGSSTDYITPTAKVYKDYGNGYFYPKKSYKNNKNSYLYIGITFSDGKNKSKRLHVLLANAYLPNPDPNKLKYVGHKDNIKWHCSLDNLYWTNNQDNSQKAVDDNLSKNDFAENDSQSEYVKVLDKTTMQVVGVYGSIRQCVRCVENISVGFVAKMCKKESYKPRSRKYIYQYSDKNEFDEHKSLQNVRLVEADKANKNPKVFKMINKNTGYSGVFDNQRQASSICGISQARISKLIKTNGEQDGWSFEFLSEIEYKNSSGFKHKMDLIEGIAIKNINTGEIMSFDCKQYMLDYFGIHGNDAGSYVNKGNKIMHEWVVI